MAARFSVFVAVWTSCLPAAAEPYQQCPEGWFCEPEPVEPPERRSAPEPPAHARSTVSHEPSPLVRYPEPEVRRNLALLLRGHFALPTADAWPLMGGGGLGVRLLPLKHVAADFAMDAIWGRDVLAASRREATASAALVAFFNTRQPVQVFLSSGFFYSWARVSPVAQQVRNFRYLGAFLGLGGEYAVNRSNALSIDIKLFVRGRVDGGSQPEFVNQKSGETSNASGGSLVGFALIRSF